MSRPAGPPQTVKIGERSVRADERHVIEVRNPAERDEVVGTVPSFTAQDVHEVFEVASAAQERWRAFGWVGRGAFLHAAAHLVRTEADRLTRLIVRENGKLWAEAAVEVAKTADFLEYYGSFGRQPYGSLLGDAREDTYTSSRREPLGVVLLITPWNDPLLTPARKLAPALVCGNAVVLKPAMETPLIALELAWLLEAAGLPAGVLSVVPGEVAEISPALLGAPALAGLSFTGSTAVGNHLRATVAHRNLPVQTEMGGKNAALVLDTADLDVVVPCVLQGAFVQAGQRCTATSRLIVGEDRADALLAALGRGVAALRPGPGENRDSTFGPVIDDRRASDVLAHVERAQAHGVSVAAGGSRLSDGRFANGSFVAPTILDQVQPDHDVWAQEVFGPVLSVHRVEMSGADLFGEGVRLTNDSAYGLACSVFTSDLGEALAFADAAEAGQVSVNLPTSGWDVHHPFGGFADSGSAFKEQGFEALSFYTRTKTVAMHYAPPARDG
jgi:acyl-CoA reductase-like NAD-dependent aldehyde dehydrogenase